jgi:radical SAM protein with 4Fe4S-binding SPASM domain
LDLVSSEYKDIVLTFHGGEPSLASLGFYRKVFSFQKYLWEERGAKFYNNFTTNGFALDEALVELLIDKGVLFNVSYDGPHNDDLREHSFAVYKRIADLKQRGASLRVYCVESALSAHSLIQTYEWFKERKLDFKIVPIAPLGKTRGRDDLILDIGSFTDKLAALYEFWARDKNRGVRAYTLEEFLSLEREVSFKSRWFNRKLALSPDGKIYPFGRPNDLNFCLGDPFSIQNINSCFTSPRYLRLEEILEKLMSEFCPACESKKVCGGLALSSSFVYDGDHETLRYSCDMANMIFQKVLLVNDAIRKDIEAGRGRDYDFMVLKRFGAAA